MVKLTKTIHYFTSLCTLVKITIIDANFAKKNCIIIYNASSLSQH
jgi:hypothetical protein